MAIRKKHHPNWSNLARKGIDKYASLSSNGMRAYSKKYREAGNKYSDLRKEHFYEFVARNRLRKR